VTDVDSRSLYFRYVIYEYCLCEVTSVVRQALRQSSSIFIYFVDLIIDLPHFSKCKLDSILSNLINLDHDSRILNRYIFVRLILPITVCKKTNTGLFFFCFF